MKGKISDEVRLRHILDAIDFIEKFSADKSRADLYKNFMYRFSVERQLEIIWEAANNLSSSLIASYPEVKWPQIISFRNFIVHEYFGLDLELVWNIILVHIPELKVHVAKIVIDIQNTKE